MTSVSFHRFTLRHAIGFTLFAGLLAGCNTDIVSYNREFRTQGLQQYGRAEWASAASSFSNALRQEPGDYTSRFYLGVCEEQMGKLQQAIHQYKTTLNVMDNSLEGKGDFRFRAKVVNSMALAIAREGDRSGDLAQLEAQPRSAETSFMLARIYRQVGDADSSLSRFDQAQRLDPKDPTIAKEYGLYLERLGQTQRADNQLRHAYALNSNDDEVMAALRRLGVIPGPSLKGEDGLEKPFVPLGPLPELDVTTSTKQPAPLPSATPQQSAPPVPSAPGAVGTTGSPRD